MFLASNSTSCIPRDETNWPCTRTLDATVTLTQLGHENGGIPVWDVRCNDLEMSMRRSIHEIKKRRTLEHPSARNPSRHTHILLPSRLLRQQSPHARRLSS
jgi:hypothetical protein